MGFLWKNILSHCSDPIQLLPDDLLSVKVKLGLLTCFGAFRDQVEVEKRPQRRIEDVVGYETSLLNRLQVTFDFFLIKSQKSSKGFYVNIGNYKEEKWEIF